MSNSDAKVERILIWTPIGRDTALVMETLSRAGLTGVPCENLETFSSYLKEGADVGLLAEEALSSESIRRIVKFLDEQPPWSDFPFVILTSGGKPNERNAERFQTLEALRNLTLLERPMRPSTLVAAVRAALRARCRQYEVRNYLSERMRTEQELNRLLIREQKARGEAEAANRAKDDFLANVSHELRTPLTAILGWARILRSGTLDEAGVAHAIETIERNAKAQAQLIEDLLDISRIISGKLILNMAPVELAGVIHAAIDSMRPAADAKNIQIAVTKLDAGDFIYADSDRLQQVIWNLISNAVKFTPGGGQVEIQVRHVDSHVEIQVSDTGQGISADFLPYVFDRFRQADSKITRTHGGLGLGLAIVRHLVELHGGTVRVASQGEGKGATFTVRLPRASVRATAKSTGSTHVPIVKAFEYPPIRLDGLHVLVVDDEADAREVIGFVLKECQAEVTTAGSAAEALELIQCLKPDVLVSDIGMPGENGYDLIRRVRAQEKGNSPLPAIALTAYARVEDRMSALSAGYQMHVPKPIEPIELVTVIASLVGRAGTPEESPKT